MKRIKIITSDDEVSSQVDEIEDWSEFEKVEMVPASEVPLFDEYEGTSSESDAETRTKNKKSISPLAKDKNENSLQGETESGKPSAQTEPKREYKSTLPKNERHYQWTQKTENEYNQLRKAGISYKQIGDKFGMSTTSVRRLHAKFIDDSSTLEWNDENCTKLINVWRQKRTEICRLLHNGLTPTMNIKVSRTQVGKQFLCLVKDGRAKMN